MLWGAQGEYGCMPAVQRQNAARRVAGLEAFQAAQNGQSGQSAASTQGIPAMQELRRAIQQQPQQQQREGFVVRNDDAVQKLIKNLQARI